MITEHHITGRAHAGFFLAAIATFALLAVFAALPAPSAAAELAPKVRSLGGGAWSWFGDPRGLHHQGRYNRTYVGWIDQQGNVKVASYDHNTRLRTTAVIRWDLQIDDHDNPSLHVLPDGRLMVFYSRHSGNRMFYRISTRPENVTSWSKELNVTSNTPGTKGFTYPNPIQLSGERNRLWLFFRGGSWQPSFSRSPDNGETWSRARTLIHQTGQRPYVKYASNGRDKIHFAFTQGNPGSSETNIYYAHYRAGALYRANGKMIKSMRKLPLSPSQADTVYDTDTKTWVHDIALTRSGQPVIVFAVLPSDEEHHYYYARWTGTAWKTHPITPAGGSFGDPNSVDDRYYSAGITLDHESPNNVYLSRDVNGMYEVEKWRTGDGGQSWSHEAVTSGSSVKNVRPISPRGLRSFDDDMSVIWMRGNYATYVNYETDITTRLLNGGNIPPIAELTAVPRRGTAPLRVGFDASRSRDPDGSRLAYTWDFGDGTRGRGRSVSHVYKSPGRYYARLTVTDADGDRDVFVSEVKVYRPPSR